MVNLVSSIEGEEGKFLQAEYKTMSAIFPIVYLIPIQSWDPMEVQNLMLIGIKGERPTSSSINPKYAQFLEKIWTKPIPRVLPILTDDFAPVDQYVFKAEVQKSPNHPG